MSKARQFQVASGGPHVHDDGRSYKVGMIVKSDHDLVKMFPNKFTEVGVLPVPSTALLDRGDALEDVISEKRAQKIREQQADEDLSDGGVAAAKKSAKVAAAARGLDVTKHFPKAADEGFTVCKREKLYHVYEGDSTDPINKKALAKDEVESFVEKHLDE